MYVEQIFFSWLSAKKKWMKDEATGSRGTEHDGGNTPGQNMLLGTAGHDSGRSVQHFIQENNVPAPTVLTFLDAV